MHYKMYSTKVFMLVNSSRTFYLLKFEIYDGPYKKVNTPYNIVQRFQ